MGQPHADISAYIRSNIDSAIPAFEKMPGVVIIINLQTYGVEYMNRAGLKILGISLPELREMGSAYHERFFNPEDAKDYVPKILGLIERNTTDEIVTFFQQVKANEKEDWQWYFTSVGVFLRDNDGKPLLNISIATPVEPGHYFVIKLQRMLEERLSSAKNKHLLTSLGKRETEILSLMVRDLTSKQIADNFSISEDTVKTHRRNIKKKLGIQNDYELFRFAQIFDIV